MDLAQILAAFAANPNLKAQILESLSTDAATHLTGKGMIVKTKEVYDSEQAVRDQETIRKALAGETGNLWSGVEAIVEAMYGLTKPDGMKVPAWIKQLEADDMFPVDPKSIKTQLKNLKEGKGKGDGGNPTDNALITQLQNELKTLKDTQAQDKKNAFERMVTRLVEADLNNANVALNPSLKDDEKAAAKTSAISDLVSIINSIYEPKEDKNGDVYFVKRGTDTALMNTATSKPLSPLDIIKTHHKYLLAVDGHQQQGGGTGNPPAGGGGPVSTKSITQIRKEAYDKGFAAYTDDWNKFVNEEAQKAGIKL